MREVGELDDLVANLTPNLIGDRSAGRIQPDDPPCVYGGHIEAKRRTVPIAGRIPADALTIPGRGDPQILDGSTFERPLETHIPLGDERRTIQSPLFCFGSPITDKLAIEHKFVAVFLRWAVCHQSCNKAPIHNEFPCRN
ncbi:hypothetical protein BO068_005009 [Escherichia coli]|nr:hypothetical protein [Salmonella enterica subsp. enterica]EFG2885815.1 hypothetical protein [Escherichia coli]